jgi:hypothetical protein
MVRRSFSDGSKPAGIEQVANAVRAYWRGIVEAFDRKGFDEPRKATRFRIDSSWHDSCRHYAGAKTDGTVLVIAPEILDLAEESIIAILAHEGGHFVDLARPGRFFFRRPTEMHCRKGASVTAIGEGPPDPLDPVLLWFKELPTKGLGKHLTEWRERDSDELERVADEIATFVMGEKIGYTGSPGCLIQTLGKGVERPIGLR